MGGPHRAAAGSDGVRNHYFMRTGGSTTVIPHRMLAALFNARPEPRLVLDVVWDRATSVLVSLRNYGPGTARNIRVRVLVRAFEGHVTGALQPSPGSPFWIERGAGIAILRPAERLFSEEPIEVGRVDLMSAVDDAVFLDARVDSETTRPLIVGAGPGRAALRMSKPRSFGLPDED